jgi:hypothetical protein
LSFAVIRNVNVGSSIIALLKAGCPFAVTWLVMAIDVNALYGVGWGWLFAHIFEKRLETIVANFNPPPSIAMIMFMFGV